MLDVSHKNLIGEVQAAEKWRDRYLDDLVEQRYSYTGPGYRDWPTDLKVDPENHIYEYVALIVAQWTLDQPRVRMATHLGGMAEIDTLALQYATNDWIREVDLRSTLEQAAVDWALKYSVCLVQREPRPGMYEFDDPPWWPQVYPLDLRCYFWDPAPYNRKQWRYQGHDVLVDKEDLIKRARRFPEEGWNVEVIKKMAVVGQPYARAKDSGSGSGAEPDVPDRGMVRLREMWVPEYQIAGKKRTAGYNGTIFTIATEFSNGQGAPVEYPRDPRPFWGHASGPYAFGGCYCVPGEAVPLAPVAAMKTQVRHLNDIVRATTQAIEDYKKMVLIAAGDPKLAKIITEGEHHGAYSVGGLDEIEKHIAPVEVGGATQQHFIAEERARNMLDRGSGLNDPQRGNVTGAATATEVATAASAGSARINFQVLKFRGFVRDIITKVAWLIHNDTKYRANIAGAIPALINPKTGEPLGDFKGGKPKGRKIVPLEAIKIDIQVGSMERSSEAQNAMRLAAFDQTITMYAPGMATMPWVNWNQVVKKRAELLDMPELLTMFDTGLAANIAAANIGMEQTPEQKVASAQSPTPFMTQTMGPMSSGKPPPREQPLDAVRKSQERPN